MRHAFAMQRFTALTTQSSLAQVGQLACTCIQHRVGADCGTNQGKEKLISNGVTWNCVTKIVQIQLVCHCLNPLLPGPVHSQSATTHLPHHPGRPFPTLLRQPYQLRQAGTNLLDAGAPVCMMVKQELHQLYNPTSLKRPRRLSR